MKILLYFEGEKLIQTSGIGRAFKHQKAALEIAGVDYTTEPKDDYDILHINTWGVTSQSMVAKARRDGKHVIFHAHSTEEDFRNSFVLSNQIAPIVKKILISLYSSADHIITPTPYSKKLLEGYGIEVPITDISNGIDLNRFDYDAEKVKAFRKYFTLQPSDKVILSVGLYFERKGILDFMEVAKRLPEYKFIWFGYTPLLSIPKIVRDAIADHPTNVILPGYVKGPIIEGAYANSDVFFFPTLEETEGIVVLEALAGKCQAVIRDIGAFDPWMKDGVNCYKGNDIDEFVKLLKGCITLQLPSTIEEGYLTAKERSIPEVGQQLKHVYEQVMTLPIIEE